MIKLVRGHAALPIVKSDSIFKIGPKSDLIWREKSD